MERIRSSFVNYNDPSSVVRFPRTRNPDEKPLKESFDHDFVPQCKVAENGLYITPHHTSVSRVENQV